MQFIDHTGHIFSLPHYSSKPIGYEYMENDYIFWLTSEYTSELSVDCIYIQGIRPIFSDPNLYTVTITCEQSNHFRLVSPLTIQQKISAGKNIFEIDLDYYTDEALEHNPEFNNDFRTELTNNELLFVTNLYEENWFWSDENQNVYQYADTSMLPEPDEEGNRYIERNGKTYLLSSRDINYTMVPFYVAACNVKQAGAWTTNILIRAYMRTGEVYYCPITVGGVFNDECEELIINGKNIGVNLPKEICKSFYTTHFSTDYVDMKIWNNKIKEYLLQHITLRSERGNYRSAINALKWFGWHDKLELYALIQTDNEVVDQYILDAFDLNYDVINEFRNFRNSTLLNLYFRGTIEDKDNISEYDFKDMDEFYGEGKPYTKDLFNQIIEHRYDENDIPFYRPFYDHTFNEIGLKLSALKYFYQKYFLPIHLNVYNSTVTFQTFANNVKFTNSVSTLLTVPSKYVYDSIDVKFGNGIDISWLSEEVRYIDIIDDTKKFSLDNSNWIEFGRDLEYATKFSDYSVFEIDDNCFSVPITFIANDEYKYYSCVLRLYKDGEAIKTSTFSFVGESKETTINFIIYPALINKNFDINFWQDSKYHIDLLVNGVWFGYDFEMKVPELDIEMCKLEYKYNYNLFKQFNGFGREYLFTSEDDEIYVRYKNENTIIFEDNEYELIFGEDTPYFYIDDKKYIANKIYRAYNLINNTTGDDYIYVNVEESDSPIIKYNDENYNTIPVYKANKIEGDGFIYVEIEVDENGNNFAKINDKTYLITELFKAFKIVKNEVTDEFIYIEKIINKNGILVAKYGKREFEINITEDNKEIFLIDDENYNYEIEQLESGRNIFGLKSNNEYELESNNAIYHKFSIDNNDYVLSEYLNETYFRNIPPIRFNAYMYVPDLVKVSNINFINEYIQYMQNKHMHYVSADNAVFKDNIYYYYYDNTDEKVILSNGKFVLRFNSELNRYELVRRDILDIIRNMTQEEINETFPDIQRLLTYDGDLDDIDDPVLKHILSELNETIELDNGKFTKNEIIEIPEGVTLYSSIYKNIYSFIDLYTEKVKLPRNMNYFNKVHLFEVKKQNENLSFENIKYDADKSSQTECIEVNMDGVNSVRFGDNDTQYVVDLYSEFFDENGDWKIKFEKLNTKNKKWEETTLEKDLYDLYLMHDNDVWYCVMISKYPIGDNKYYNNVSDQYRSNENIYLRHLRSDEKFLINRMDLVSMKNTYHYSTTDMIVAKLNNYKNIPFKLIAGSKWTFTPVGIGMNITEVIESNTNFAIMSVTGSDIKHSPGYYTVKVSYSVDNFSNNAQERTTKMLITKS